MGTHGARGRNGADETPLKFLYLTCWEKSLYRQGISFFLLCFILFNSPRVPARGNKNVAFLQQSVSQEKLSQGIFTKTF
jgi:hypothetical protein